MNQRENHCKVSLRKALLFKCFTLTFKCMTGISSLSTTAAENVLLRSMRWLVQKFKFEKTLKYAERLLHEI